jgi:hypothetical protein
MLSCMLTACGYNWVSDFNFFSVCLPSKEKISASKAHYGESNVKLFPGTRGLCRQMTIAWLKCQSETPTFRSIQDNFAGGEWFKPCFSVDVGWPKRLK